MQKNHSILRFAFTALALCLLFNINAQEANKAQRLEQAAQKIKQQNEKVEKVVMSEERETPYLVSFKKDKEDAYSIQEAKAIIEKTLDIKKNTTKFEFDKIIKLADGMKVHRFEQYHNGVKVEHGDYVALEAKGKLASINGEYYQVEDVNTTATLTEEQALKIAIDWVGAESYAHNYVMEHYNGVIAPELGTEWYKAYQEYYPKGEIVIVDDYNTEEVDVDLAYKFNIYALEPISRGEIYVNAHTGEIMLNDPIIKHLNNPYTGPSAQVETRYSGTQTVNTKLVQVSAGDPNPLADVTNPLGDLTDSRSTSPIGPFTNLPFTLTDGSTEVYVLIDESKSEIYPGVAASTTIETYDCNAVGGAPLSLPIYGQARSFTDNDNDWTNVEHKRSGEDTDGSTTPEFRQHDDDIAWDAHWGASVVYDYWQEIHERDSYDDNGAAILSYVHIGPNYDNAFWNGTAMSYGDGSSFKSLTALDVCGHEIGHAVCSNTSDLVYARQSGGMNEGFSDIWGACTEYYQIAKNRLLPLADQQDIEYTGTATNNNNGYRVWGIGEQIDEGGDNALRWMDSPKIAGDPDTFDGDNWTETENCEPTLANDQCGVHSNSGVLNKWFYLLTCGSKDSDGPGSLGSGPDADLAGTGPNADDGMRDAAGGAVNSIPYNVFGLGFEISEKIAFATEVRLTPNGTFAEARAASIDYVAGVYGPCSAEMESTMNAWNGIGVGEAYGGCNSVDGFVFEASSIFEANDNPACDAINVQEVEVYFISDGADVIATASIIGGTATEGLDYDIPNKTISGTNVVPLVINVYDDAIVEGEETIELMIGNTAHTVTIQDNDVAPALGNARIDIINQTFDASFDISSNDWAVINQIGNDDESAGLNWAFDNTSGAYVYPTLAGIALDAAPGYDGNTNGDIILRSPLIDARGLTNINITADIMYGGETDADANLTPFDYGVAVISFDGINFVEIGDRYGTLVGPLSATIDLNLDASFDNQLFYVGFRWYNDPLVGTAYSLSVSETSVTGLPKKVESTLTHSKSEEVKNTEGVFFLSEQDGDLISKIENADANMGCVVATVTQEGDGTTAFNTTELRTNKVTSHIAGTTGTYDLTVYYTTAELGGLDVSSARIIGHPTDIEMATTYNTTYTDMGNDNHAFTATLSGVSNFVAISNSTALAVDLVNLQATTQDRAIALDWTTATETDNKGFELLRSTEADKNFEAIAWIDGQGTTTSLTAYNFVDRDVQANVTYFYQLKTVNFNGIAEYSNIVSAQVKGDDSTIVIAPNPANDFVNVSINNVTENTKVSILSVDGKVLSTQNVDGVTTRLDLSKYPAGIYLVRLSTATGSTINRVVKQ